MRIFLVMYSSERNDEVLQVLERLNIESVPFTEKGPGKPKNAKQKEKQLWAGTRTILALSVAEDREAVFLKALQDVNDAYPDVGVRAFAFEAEDVG